MSYDDCLLVSTGEDGAVVMMDVRDKELMKSSTRRDQVGFGGQPQWWGDIDVQGKESPALRLPGVLGGSRGAVEWCLVMWW